jgi:hypothetical protein
MASSAGGKSTFENIGENIVVARPPARHDAAKQGARDRSQKCQLGGFWRPSCNTNVTPGLETRKGSSFLFMDPSRALALAQGQCSML